MVFELWRPATSCGCFTRVFGTAGNPKTVVWSPKAHQTQSRRSTSRIGFLNTVLRPTDRSIQDKVGASEAAPLVQFAWHFGSAAMADHVVRWSAWGHARLTRPADAFAPRRATRMPLTIGDATVMASGQAADLSAGRVWIASRMTASTCSRSLPIRVMRGRRTYSAP